MTALVTENLSKRFVLHNQGGTRLDVFRNVSFAVAPGEAVVLSGASGVGKSTLLRLLYGNYRPTAGQVRVAHRGGTVDLVNAAPRVLIDVRRHTLGWVSQFLRVIPRVPTLEVVRDPMLARGIAPETATRRAKDMLARLNLPEPLWSLAPATFSGGEQQRVNLARSFCDPAPILLLDEPTASLDAANRDVVVDLIIEARRNGSAIVGIFHDEAVRDRVATRLFDLTRYKTGERAA